MPKEETESAKDQGVSAEAQADIGNRLRREIRHQSCARLRGVRRQRCSPGQESRNHFNTQVGLPESKDGKQCAAYEAG